MLPEQPLPEQLPNSVDDQIQVDLNLVVDSLLNKLTQANILASKWEAAANTAQRRVLELAAKLVALEEKTPSKEN